MKIVVENIFMCLVLFWKCYFPTKFSHFLSYFLNIQTNFITENIKQFTAKSQHHTPPELQFNPRQQTLAIKSHNHQNTTTTPPQQQQKSKSQREREREISGSKIDGLKARSRGGEIEGEIERHGAISTVLRLTRPVRSGACDRRTGARGSPAMSKVWSGLPLLPLALSLSLGLETIWSENRNGKEF